MDPGCHIVKDAHLPILAPRQILGIWTSVKPSCRARRDTLRGMSPEGRGDEMDYELVERVKAELVRRDWSVSQAATKAPHGVVDQTWHNWFARGGYPSPRLARSIAEAFDWDENWPECPPLLPVNLRDPDVLEELAAVRQQLKDMTDGVLEATEERRRLLRATTKALRVLVKMEARQLRAFALLGLDPSVDLDDARLDDPTYAATLREQPRAGRAQPTGRRRPVRNG
jgi:hypothetical protein